MSLAEAAKQEEVQKALAKEQEKVDKDAKAERAKTDRHDRSGKAQQTRKDGKGTGGWDDAKLEVEIAQEDVVEEEKEEKKDKKEKDDGKSEEQVTVEAKVEEANQMTLDEYMEKQKKENAPVAPALSLRQVDTSVFKGMVAKEGKEKGEKKFQIGADKKEKKAPVPKKEEKKDEKKEKVQVDVGFRMGKGKGEGKGQGKGKGRGGYDASNSESAIKVDDEKAFPALGGGKSTDAGEVEASV